MQNIDNRAYKEVRCTNCRRLLAMEYIYSGRIVIKCRCGEMNKIEYKTPARLIKKLNPNNDMIIDRKITTGKGGEQT